MYFVAAPVCVAKQTGIGATLSRCRFLTKGCRWQIFVAILLTGIFSRASGNTIFRRGGAPSISNGLPTIVGIFAASVGIWVVYGAFSAVFAAVFYDRLRSTVHMAKIFD
jgi:hypothetical protein